jgi:hypothetical protein
MIKSLRIRLARWILGTHCPCYQMGYHTLIDFEKAAAESAANYRGQRKTSSSTSK